MAWIMNQLPEHDITRDCANNPEILLMQKEGDEDSGETESQWIAGTYVTQPKQSTYDK